MLTPLDMTNKEFKKNIFGGYNEDEVNEFLDRVIEDYEKLYKENLELKDKISVLNEGLQHYKSIEDALQNTLLAAQQTSDDIKKNAYTKAENIIKEAELKAMKMIEDANREVMRIKYEYEDIKKRYYMFKSKIETIIMAQLESMKASPEDELDLKELKAASDMKS